jgi:hypothetical protein
LQGFYTPVCGVSLAHRVRAWGALRGPQHWSLVGLQYGEFVRFDLPGALHSNVRTGSRRTLWLSVAAAVLVVAAAGLAGTAHFGALRWVPHLSSHSGPTSFSVPKTLTTPRRQPTPPPTSTRFAFGPLLLWIGVGLGVCVILALAWRWWAGRRPRVTLPERPLAMTTTVQPLPTEPEPEPEAPVLRSGIELALAMLDEDRDPGDAIVRAWLGLEETAEQSGMVRLPAETPTEFTSRILGRAFTDDRAIATLLALYLRTRFGDHPVTGDDVAAVRTALQELAASWRAPIDRPVQRMTLS